MLRLPRRPQAIASCLPAAADLLLPRWPEAVAAGALMIKHTCSSWNIEAHLMASIPSLRPRRLGSIRHEDRSLYTVI